MMTNQRYLWILITTCIYTLSTPLPTSSKPEPETSTESHTESSNGNGLPEPVPDWTSAFQEWKWAWPLHVYLFGILYIGVAMTAFIHLVIEFVARKLSFNRLKVSFFSQMAVFGFIRAVLLFIDPYISKRLSNGLPTFIVWSLGMPLILSTFALLLFALVDTTRINLAPPRFQNLLVVSGISVANLCLVFMADLIVIYQSNSGIMVFLCQIYLSSFGLLLCVGFLFVAHKLSHNANALPRHKMKRLQYLVYTSAFIGLSLVCSEVYSATQVFGVLKKTKDIPPWPWLGLQTCARIIEMAMCVVILFAFKRTKSSVQDFPADTTA